MKNRTPRQQPNFLFCAFLCLLPSLLGGFIGAVIGAAALLADYLNR